MSYSLFVTSFFIRWKTHQSLASALILQDNRHLLLTMHSASAITLLSALSVLVNAAPAIDKRQGPATRTITQKAPFQEPEKLPVLPNGVTVVDLDMSEYASFGYPEDSDQFKCHGTCGKKTTLIINLFY